MVTVPGRARVWTVLGEDGRPRMAIGQHKGKDIDAVPERYLRFILDTAERRPGSEEELELRVAAGEVGGGTARAAREEWSNVCIGNRSFSIPPGVAQLFDAEMTRMQQLFPREAQAFEAIVLCSSTTPLEGME